MQNAWATITLVMNMYLYIHTLLSQEEKGFFFSAPFFNMNEALSPTKGKVCASIYIGTYIHFKNTQKSFVYLFHKVKCMRALNQVMNLYLYIYTVHSSLGKKRDFFLVRLIFIWTKPCRPQKEKFAHLYIGTFIHFKNTQKIHSLKALFVSLVRVYTLRRKN